MVLRFVPYIGAILAAGLPIALAAAVGSDWTMTLWTVILFAMVEPRHRLGVRDSGTDCFDRRFPQAARRSHRRQSGDPVPGPDSDGHLKKPAKTREELEAAIRLEMEDICEWPTDMAISVVPYEDSWKVSIMRDGPQPDADRCEMIEAIADRLGNQFDLKG
jgi:hypothetical protein